MNPDAPTREGVVAAVSGFKPMLTGTVCDRCNAGLTQGDEVLVALDHHQGQWVACSTNCAEHDVETHETITNAVVRCELGPLFDGEHAPLYNPDVVEFREV